MPRSYAKILCFTPSLSFLRVPQSWFTWWARKSLKNNEIKWFPTKSAFPSRNWRNDVYLVITFFQCWFLTFSRAFPDESWRPTDENSSKRHQEHVKSRACFPRLFPTPFLHLAKHSKATPKLWISRCTVSHLHKNLQYTTFLRAIHDAWNSNAIACITILRAMSYTTFWWLTAWV